jgi:hypothetical protein
LSVIGSSQPPRSTTTISKRNSAHLLIEALIDLRNLRNPALALGVLQCQDLLVRPVKVISNVRYLLI